MAGFSSTSFDFEKMKVFFSTTITGDAKKIEKSTSTDVKASLTGNDNYKRITKTKTANWIEASTTCNPPTSAVLDSSKKRLAIQVCQFGQYALYQSLPPPNLCPASLSFNSTRPNTWSTSNCSSAAPDNYNNGTARRYCNQSGSNGVDVFWSEVDYSNCTCVCHADHSGPVCILGNSQTVSSISCPYDDYVGDTSATRICKTRNGSNSCRDVQWSNLEYDLSSDNCIPVVYASTVTVWIGLSIMIVSAFMLLLVVLPMTCREMSKMCDFKKKVNHKKVAWLILNIFFVSLSFADFVTDALYYQQSAFASTALRDACFVCLLSTAVPTFFIFCYGLFTSKEGWKSLLLFKTGSADSLDKLMLNIIIVPTRFVLAVTAFVGLVQTKALAFNSSQILMERIQGFENPMIFGFDFSGQQNRRSTVRHNNKSVLQPAPSLKKDSNSIAIIDNDKETSAHSNNSASDTDMKQSARSRRNGDYEKTSKHRSISMEIFSSKIYRLCVLFEVFVESLPQLLIQTINTYLTKQFSTIFWVSMSFVAYSIARSLYPCIGKSISQRNCAFKNCMPDADNPHWYTADHFDEEVKNDDQCCKQDLYDAAGGASSSYLDSREPVVMMALFNNNNDDNREDKADDKSTNTKSKTKRLTM